MGPWAMTRRNGRGLSGMLLLGFLVALLLGAFHPLGPARGGFDAHVCHDGAEQHVDAPHDHEHDASACALCHLVRDLDAEVALASPSLEGAAPAGAAPAAPVARAPLSAPPASFRSRAPPAA